MKFDIDKEFMILKQKDFLEESWFKKSRIVFKNRTDIIEYFQQHKLFDKKQVAKVATFVFLGSGFFHRPARETLGVIAHIVDPENYELMPWPWRGAMHHPFIIDFIESYIDSFDSIEDAMNLMYSEGSEKKYSYLISDAQKLITDESKLHKFNSNLKLYSPKNLEYFLDRLSLCLCLCLAEG